MECEWGECHAPKTLMLDVTASLPEDRANLTDHLGHRINNWQGAVGKIPSMLYFGHNGLAVGDVNGDGFENPKPDTPNLHILLNTFPCFNNPGKALTLPNVDLPYALVQNVYSQRKWN